MIFVKKNNDSNSNSSQTYRLYEKDARKINEPVPIKKIATKIKGLDKILHGGIPNHRTTLIVGGPGTGKTIFGIELLYLNAKESIPGIFISFEEQKKSILMNAYTFGWDLIQLEQENKLKIIDGTLSSDTIIAGEFDLNGFLAIIEKQAKTIGASLIVIDAIDVILRLMNDPNKERNELRKLHRWLKNHEMTAIITMKNQDGEKTSRYTFLEYMTDCVIYLTQRVFEQVTTKRLHIAKYRGSSFGNNEYPYIIDKKGIVLVPITNTSLSYSAPSSVTSFGISKLDRALDGGVRKGSAVIISGPSGSGKTTLLSTFARSAAKRGEKVLYISFEESEESLIDCMKKAGIDLHPFIESHLLSIASIMPESTGVEYHLIDILRLINEFQPDHIIVEAISSCKRMGSFHSAFDFLVRLIHSCKEKSITCLLSNQNSAKSRRQDDLEIDISSIVDTQLVLRYVYADGKMKRAFLIHKSRGMNHSNKYWEYQINGDGVKIGQPIRVELESMITLQKNDDDKTKRGKG